MKTIDYLNMIEKNDNYKNITDYRKAKILGIGQSTISNYRKQTRFFDEEVSKKVGEMLDIDPAIIFADASIERAIRSKKRTNKKIWESIAKALKATAAMVLITAITALGNTNTSYASSTYKEVRAHTVYYVK